MKVQIQLRKLLQDRGLDRRGIIQKISASTKLDRRVIAKYYIPPLLTCRQTGQSNWRIRVPPC